MVGVETNTEGKNHSKILETIESEGWKLEHANYVFRMLETVSRDKLLSSGQQGAIKGETIAYYIFRRAEKKKVISE
jgi:hypothetical protein